MTISFEEKTLKQHIPVIHATCPIYTISHVQMTFPLSIKGHEQNSHSFHIPFHALSTTVYEGHIPKFPIGTQMKVPYEWMLPERIMLPRSFGGTNFTTLSNYYINSVFSVILFLIILFKSITMLYGTSNISQSIPKYFLHSIECGIL